MSNLNYLGRVGKEIVALDPSGRRFIRIQLVEEPPESMYLFMPFELNDSRPADPFDPARPELVEAESITPTTSKPKRRKLRRVLSKMVAPEGLPPLWLAGPSVKYATMTGDSPSVALLRIGRRQALLRDARTDELQFGFPWKGGFHSFSFAEDYKDLLLPEGTTRLVGRKSMKPLLAVSPHAILIAFSAPVDGYCKKLVVRVLPKL